MRQDELRECVVCHLDSVAELMTNGVCEECVDRFEKEDRFCTEFQKTHGHDYDWGNDDC
jgi:hypothetical protein